MIFNLMFLFYIIKQVMEFFKNLVRVFSWLICYTVNLGHNTELSSVWNGTRACSFNTYFRFIHWMTAYHVLNSLLYTLIYNYCPRNTPSLDLFMSPLMITLNVSGKIVIFVCHIIYLYKNFCVLNLLCIIHLN